MRAALPGFLGTLLAAFVLGALGSPALLVAQDAAGREAAPSPDTCAFCHQGATDAVPGDPHGAGAAGLTFAEGGGTCASCHVGARQHLDEGGGAGNILAFGDGQPSGDATAACLTCHVESHPRFPATEHAGVGLSCADCHLIHQPSYDEANLLDIVDLLAATNPARRPDPASVLCTGCHLDVGARFDMNERHRLVEGGIGCTSCHAPHDPWGEDLLDGFGRSGTCVACHAAQGGPFVFEHDAARVDGCTACHDPHGSPNRHMLSFQDQGQLCYACHVEMPGFHLGSPVRFDQDANCTNCHTAIHGSNLDPYFLR